MSDGMAMKFQIVPYANTRRTTYTLKDVVKAIRSVGLTHSRETYLIEVICPLCPTIIKRLEDALRLVHRNVAYRKEII